MRNNNMSVMVLSLALGGAGCLPDFMGNTGGVAAQSDGGTPSPTGGTTPGPSPADLASAPAPSPGPSQDLATGPTSDMADAPTPTPTPDLAAAPTDDLAGAPTPTPDLSMPPAPTCDSLQPSPGTGQHNAGQDCQGCHAPGGGALTFYLGGTLYSAASGGTAVVGGTINVTDAAGQKLKLVSANNGNFWTTTPLTFPVTVNASLCPSTVPMNGSVGGNGACNNCHNSTFRVHVP